MQEGSKIDIIDIKAEVRKGNLKVILQHETKRVGVLTHSILIEDAISGERALIYKEEEHEK